MMLPFCSLHALAAERGDGLHPELLRAMRYAMPEPHAAPPQILAVPPSCEPKQACEAGLPVKASLR